MELPPHKFNPDKSLDPELLKEDTIELIKFLLAEYRQDKSYISLLYDAVNLSGTKGTRIILPFYLGFAAVRDAELSQNTLKEIYSTLRIICASAQIIHNYSLLVDDDLDAKKVPEDIAPSLPEVLVGGVQSLINSKGVAGKVGAVVGTGAKTAGTIVSHLSRLFFPRSHEEPKHMRHGKPFKRDELGERTYRIVAAGYLPPAKGAGRYIKNQRVREEFDETIHKMEQVLSEGEFQDICSEVGGHNNELYLKEHHYKSLTPEKYYEIIQKKTGALLREVCKLAVFAATEIAGLEEKVKCERVSAAEGFGEALGELVQLTDDYNIDFLLLQDLGEKVETGKPPAADVRANKLSNRVLIELTTAEYVRPEDRKWFNKVLRRRDAHKYTKEALRRAHKYKENLKRVIFEGEIIPRRDVALQALSVFPDCLERQALENQVTNYIWRRR